MSRTVYAVLFLLLTCCGIACPVHAVEQAGAAQREVERSTAGRAVVFNRDIRPLLSDRCYPCHGPAAAHREAGLRLDQRDAAVSELDSGEVAIMPGNAQQSALMTRLLEQDDQLRMPPADSGKKRLTPDQVDRFRRWINQGASYQQHWSFMPLVRPALPAVNNLHASDQPIDRFVLARLEQQGLTPAPEADRVTLIRRLSLDLTGLPPTQREVRAFVEDSRPDAYSRLVERLLSSPHYGERMAQFWLDLVRYADTVGFHGDQTTTYWPYRDYVIEAFNANLPFDRFTREQLAGDLLPGASRQQKIAATYNRLGMMTAEGGAQPKEYLAIYAADRIRNLSGTWLGVTLGCAQCHDHKFDPFTTRDFYSMGAFFADIKELGFYGSAHNDGIWGEVMWLTTPAEQERLDQLTEQIVSLKKTLATGSPGRAVAQVEKELKARAAEKVALEKAIAKMPKTVAVEPRTMRVLPRGNWMDDSGPVVQPAVPEFLARLDVHEGRATRLDLARWLTSADNPLTSRTLVNRLWKLYFGNGICRSLNDLGAQGKWPSHPELLDTLAVELIESGWDIKHIVRTIVLSKTYRQSSQPRPELAKIDPENRLLARQSWFRLEAEQVRDGALAVSGLLVTTLGGPSVKPYQPAGYYAQLNFPMRTYQADRGEKQYRRGLYTHWQRTFLHPMLKAFDATSREECTAERPRSNTPLQALTLLNDPSFVEAARVLAERIVREGGTDKTARIDWAYRQVVSSPPKPEISKLLADLHTRHRAYYDGHLEAAKQVAQAGDWPASEEIDPAELAAWSSVARVLLNMHETITRY